MSTRSTIWREGDLHIYADLFDEDETGPLFLEYREGPFLLNLELPMALTGIIKAGMRDLATKMNGWDPQTTPEGATEHAGRDEKEKENSDSGVSAIQGVV